MSLHVAEGVLACPHCAGPLRADGSRWRCPPGHSFDVAKQGYLNLATAAEPANADTAAMLAARTRVQHAGLFDFVTRALVEAVPPTGVRTLLEVGAGTGHYLAQVVEGRPAARGIALDISRSAARRAARVHHRVASVVADVWRGVPLLTGSADVVLCVFAPRNPAEFARVLSPGGRVLVVVPTADHLAELRQAYGLLGIEPDKGGRLLAGAADFLTHERTHTLNWTGAVPTEQLDDLIRMGPNAHHSPPRVERSQRVTLSVELHVFRPRPMPGTVDSAG